MIDQLKSIGIEKGKLFAPDAKTSAILNAAGVEARAFLDRNYDLGFPPFFPTSRWAVPPFPSVIQAGSSGYTEADIYPVDGRARRLWGLIPWLAFIRPRPISSHTRSTGWRGY